MVRWPCADVKSALQLRRINYLPNKVFRSFHVFSPLKGQQEYWAKNSRLLAERQQTVYDVAEIDSWKSIFPVLRDYCYDDIKLWRQAFDIFDRDADGFISQADLQKASHFTLEKSKLLKQYDADQNNLIDFGEFVEAMYNVDVKSLKDDFEGFDAVDVSLEFDKYAITDVTKNKKYMGINEVKELMKDHSFTCVTDLDAQKLFDDFDMNRKGIIDFDDFKNWISLKK